jgi:hypothetical protein
MQEVPRIAHSGSQPNSASSRFNIVRSSDTASFANSVSQRALHRLELRVDNCEFICSPIDEPLRSAGTRDGSAKVRRPAKISELSLTDPARQALERNARDFSFITPADEGSASRAAQTRHLFARSSTARSTTVAQRTFGNWPLPVGLERGGCLAPLVLRIILTSSFKSSDAEQHRSRSDHEIALPGVTIGGDCTHS